MCVDLTGKYIFLKRMRSIGTAKFVNQVLANEKIALCWFEQYASSSEVKTHI